METINSVVERMLFAGLPAPLTVRPRSTVPQANRTTRTHLRDVRRASVGMGGTGSARRAKRRAGQLIHIA